MPADAETQNLVIGGKPGQEVIERLRGNDDEIKAFLESIGISTEPEELRVQMSDYVERIFGRAIDPRSVDPLLEALQRQGVAGIEMPTILTVLIMLLTDARCSRYGKIRDFIYLGDEECGGGHLAVDVWTVHWRGTPQVEKVLEFQHWDVAIPGPRFVMHERQDRQPDDPFPGVPDLKLPKAALKGPNNIWIRGLDRKLHARGVEGVKVRAVYQRFDDGPLALVERPHPYYETTEASCVDLMLQSVVSPPGRFPPSTFGELVGADYCLGRCGHPGIVNTGGV